MALRRYGLGLAPYFLFEFRTESKMVLNITRTLYVAHKTHILRAKLLKIL